MIVTILNSYQILKTSTSANGFAYLCLATSKIRLFFLVICPATGSRVSFLTVTLLPLSCPLSMHSWFKILVKIFPFADGLVAGAHTFHSTRLTASFRISHALT